MMMPGYLTALFLLAAAILFATGWKPLIIPDIRNCYLLVLSLATALLLPLSLWWTPLDQMTLFRIHASAVPLLLGGLAGVRPGRTDLNGGYLLVCTLMLAIIWGSVRSLYMHDPMFHWFEPGWNAPFICGLLAGVFTQHAKGQLAMLVWGSLIGEWLAAWLDNGMYRAYIGSAAWWDSLTLALAVSVFCTLFRRAIRRVAARIGHALPGLKGGGQSS